MQSSRSQPVFNAPHSFGAVASRFEAEVGLTNIGVARHWAEWLSRVLSEPSIRIDSTRKDICLAWRVPGGGGPAWYVHLVVKRGALVRYKAAQFKVRSMADTRLAALVLNLVEGHRGAKASLPLAAAAAPALGLVVTNADLFAGQQALQES